MLFSLVDALIYALYYLFLALLFVIPIVFAVRWVRAAHLTSANKILTVVGAVIIAVSALAFIRVLSNHQQSYHAEDKPEGVAFNYLFAMQHNEYARAYGYLSSNIDGYPEDVNAFIKDVHDYEGNFYGLDIESTTLKVGSVQIGESYTTVDIITDTAFSEVIGPIKSHIKDDILVTLQQNTDGKWKIINSKGYWFTCWNNPTDFGCEVEDINSSAPTSIPTLFIPPSSSPVLSSVEETKKFIDTKGGYMQALWESGFSSYATVFPTQDSPYQPGDILVFKVELSESTPILWVHEECAPTQENLDEIYSNITVEFILNTEIVPLNNFALIDSKLFDDTPCREYVALVNHWTSGEHLVETHVTYKKSLQNIGSGQLAGTYVWKYVIKVHK